MVEGKISNFCGLFLIVLFLAGVAANGVYAQDGDDDVIRVTTEYISVPISILGSPKFKLDPGSITVFEDGKPQKIEEFVSAEAPFEVVLLVDTSGSARAELELIKRSARHFINSLRQGDKVSLVGFHSGETNGKWQTTGQVLSELTADRGRLNRALENISVSNSTPYYDTLIDISNKIFSERQKSDGNIRRAFVLMTDAVDSSSAAGFEQAYASVLRTDASVYFLKVDTQPFFEDNLLGNCIGAMRFSAAQIRRYYAGFKRGSELEQITDFCKLGDFERLDISDRMYQIAAYEMGHMAETTGGGVFPVSTYSEMQKVFGDVAAELGTVHTVRYYSTNEALDGKFRKITVEIKGLPQGAKVKARTGYYAGK